MALKRLDHVNVRTSNLAAMVSWYQDVLGFEPGPRPAFSFGGAWLYCDGLPIVHLVETGTRPAALDPALEHFAIGADGLAEFLAGLRAKGVPFERGTAPGFGIQQVNVWDPDGNHIHIDFAADEKAGPDA